MTRRRVNNPLALAVLGCLAERPMHPYEISTTLRDPRQGEEHQAQLRLPLLRGRLPAEARPHRAEGDRSATAAVPSAPSTRSPRAGYTEFEDWLSELLAMPTREFTSLEAALSLMARPAPRRGRPTAGGAGRAAHHGAPARNAPRSTSPASRAFPTCSSSRELLRVAMLEAELAFVEQLVHDIRSGELPGVTDVASPPRAARRRAHRRGDLRRPRPLPGGGGTSPGRPADRHSDLARPIRRRGNACGGSDQAITSSQPVDEPPAPSDAPGSLRQPTARLLAPRSHHAQPHRVHHGPETPITKQSNASRHRGHRPRQDVCDRPR